MLFARHGRSSLVLASDPEPVRQSVGYVGVSDGWQDFAANGRMTWTYESTGKGNVAGMVEIVPGDDPVQIALGFGVRPEEAALQVSAAVAGHFEVAWDSYVAHWADFIGYCSQCPPDLADDLADLYANSAAVLRTHQDRTAPGASVASLSIPWGNARNDLGGYHLVWTRDLVESAGALVALGAHAAARRALAYLVATQEPDGHWVQNQWVDGVGYWDGVQLDEAAYPILLAGALRRAGATHMHGRTDDAQVFEHLITEEAASRMIWTAARFIARTGPATGQDRWEENEGLTPSTLAPVVAALVVAADHLPARPAAYCLELADDWNASIEDWTYATGSRLAREHGVDGHYVRIASRDVLAGGADLDAGAGPQSPAGRIDGPCRRDGGHRLPRARPLRAPPAGRPVHAVDPRRVRRAPADRNARMGPSGTATTATDTASTPTAARTTAPGSVAAGRCSSGSAATSSSRPGAIHARTWRRCARSRRRAGCCPSRSGTPPTSPSATSSSAARAARRCRSPGRMPST